MFKRITQTVLCTGLKLLKANKPSISTVQIKSHAMSYIP